MDPECLKRAGVASALWFGTMYLMTMLSGSTFDPIDSGLDAGIMGGSHLASDLIHKAISKPVTAVSSGVVTGAVYAGAEYLARGDMNVLANAGVGSAVGSATCAVFGPASSVSYSYESESDMENDD